MSYKIISKFIKDISFEIPNAQAFIMIEKEIINYNLNFDIKSQPFKENIIEVNTTLKINPNENVKHKILTEINLTSLVSIDREKLSDKKPGEALKLAVKRMLPGGVLGRKQLTKLKIYSGSEHPHSSQNPKIIDLSKLNNKNIIRN